MLFITVHEKCDVTVLALEGRVDVYGAAELERALNAEMSAGKSYTVIDFSGVTYISSSGMQALADAVASRRAIGGDLKLLRPNQQVRRMLRIIGFDRLFPSYDTLQAAVAAC